MKRVITAVLILATGAVVALGMILVLDDDQTPRLTGTPAGPSTSETSPTDDAVSPIGELGRIAFVSNRAPDSAFHVFVLRGGHRPPSRITRSSSYSSRIDWRPDGKMLVVDRGLREGRSSLVIVDVSTGDESTVLTNNRPHQPSPFGPSYSPDGKRIAFYSSKGDIYTIESDGTNLTRITRSSGVCADSYPDWSPDGEKIAFTRQCRAGGVYWVPSSGGRAVRVTERRRDISPVWSPDGTMLAFSRHSEGGGQIYVIGVESGVEEQLTEAPENYSPSWSPDGTQIVFGSNRTGDQNIWLMDADGSDERPLTMGRQTDIAPAWAPN